MLGCGLLYPICFLKELIAWVPEVEQALSGAEQENVEQQMFVSATVSVEIFKDCIQLL